MEEMFRSIQDFFSLLPTLRVVDILDILLVAFLIYKGISLIRSTNAARIVGLIVAFLLFMWLTNILQMRTIGWIMRQILELGLIALVIIFQPELRRGMERIGGRHPLAAE